MKNYVITGIAGIVTVSVAGCSGRHSSSDEKPNIIFILADDLGYGDVGVYGQKKIETPNIDRLASDGMMFTRYYTGSPVSAPSRCILLTGMHSGHAQVRGNDEWAERGDVWNYRSMIADSTLEGQRPLKPGTVTIARLLHDNGYKTGMIGKWGLGAPHTESIPTKMGFDYFFGINCQRMAHTYYPVFLYENDRRIYLDNDTVAPNTLLPEGADPLKSESYSAYTLNEYAPDRMFEKLTEFVTSNKDHPFFLFWATPIPHVALQAPEKWVDFYVEKFGDEKPYPGDKGYFPQRYPHAAYAAMVSYFDDQIGNLIQQLKNLGIYDNTLIIFSSDNGPAPNGGSDSPWFESGGPFRCEPGYAKGNVNEAGIRVPFIVNWPGKIGAGKTSDHPAVSYDIFPTLCEAAGIKVPANIDGISLMNELTGRKQKKHDFLYWEYPESGGQFAVIIDNFKVMKKNLKKDNAAFEVYDLSADPIEKTDIAGSHPELIRKAEKIIRSEHKTCDTEAWRIKALDELSSR
jgi:arylsulfatase